MVVAAGAVLVMGWALSSVSMVVGLAGGMVGLLAVVAYGTWWLRRGRHTPWSEARAGIRPGHAVVLWNPGCPYCERLLCDLKNDERITWVNVWHDRAAQRRVCDLNGGNEYVPIALVGDHVLRNPSASELTAALR